MIHSNPLVSESLSAMKKIFFILFVMSVLILCTQQSEPPPPQVETGLRPDFSAEFDNLFLSQEPLRYQDNVRFLSSVEKAKLSPKEKELVTVKLKMFLSAQSKPRPYASDSNHTGVASEIAFLRLQAVQILAKVGTKEDADFIRNLNIEPKEEHPLFEEECQKTIEELKDK